MKYVVVSPHRDNQTQIPLLLNQYRPGNEVCAVASISEVPADASVCIIAPPLSTFVRTWEVNRVDQLTVVPRNVPVIFIVHSGSANAEWLIEHLQEQGHTNVRDGGWGLWEDMEKALTAAGV